MERKDLNMKKHVFEIKDQVASNDSAKHILDDIVKPLKKKKKDIDVLKIDVYVNAKTISDVYKNFDNADGKVSIVPTIGPKQKIENRTFAKFHNVIVDKISQYLKDKEIVVHIIDCGLHLNDLEAEGKNHKTRIGEMIDSVLNMMQITKHPVWFSTASDKANFKFNHYFTQMDIINIGPDRIEGYPDCMMYSGNSNLDWIVVDVENLPEKTVDLSMNGDYDFDFFSVKQLIDKFASKWPGYFVGQFPTVPYEVGAFYREPEFDRDNQKYDMSKYKDNLKKYQKAAFDMGIRRQHQIVDAMKYIRSVIPYNGKDDKNNKSQDSGDSNISSLVNII